MRSAPPYDRLPFVRPSRKGKGRNFWAPRSTGRYMSDCELGEEYAEAAIPFLRSDRELLGYIVLGILEHGDNHKDRGIIIGFMIRLSNRLIVDPAYRSEPCDG
jgi:hypothetical protein